MVTRASTTTMVLLMLDAYSECLIKREEYDSNRVFIPNGYKVFHITSKFVMSSDCGDAQIAKDLTLTKMVARENDMEFREEQELFA